MIGAGLLPALLLAGSGPESVGGPPQAAVEAMAQARAAPVPPADHDRFERFNRRNFARYQRFDRRFLRPAALGYAHVVPKPVRGGLRHVIANLREPGVFLNYLLQLKPGKAIETAARFAINSTLGLGGLIDVAKEPGIALPHRPNGFGDTLGYYGVKPGPYLFLPLVGPTTVRDLIGGQADGLVLPLAIGHPFDQLRYQLPHAVIDGLDQRAEAGGDLHALLDDAVDPYATLRSVYLQDRAGEIAALHGQAAAPADELDDPLTDPGAAPGTASAPAAPDPAAPARR